MSLSWPGDGPPARPARREGPHPLRDPTLAGLLEISQPAPRGDGERHLARRVTILAIVVVLVVLGAAMFLHGLPTIFPTMNCSWCFNARP